jgi:YesN/AraC family two-component response regulator
VAFDGLEGYEVARRNKPDLIISDIAMPRLNGVEMAIKVTDELGTVKILLISGQAVTVALLQQAQARGYSFDWLVKPVHPMALLNKVESMLARR